MLAGRLKFGLSDEIADGAATLARKVLTDGPFDHLRKGPTRSSALPHS
jgi:hypothetical protein